MARESVAIAKITRPRLPAVVQRKRLFSLIDRHRVEYPGVWITGPAGSGKTTLVASYLDTRNLPYIWYTIDGGDSDIASFFYYLGLAAKKTAPHIKRPMPLLAPEYAFGIPTFTRRYFEELFARLKHSSVVVFDNCHHIPETALLHEVMQIGLSVVPEDVTIIMISRSEPPPIFAGLRANKRLDVVGWEDLRFTLKESRGIVRLESGKRLSPQAVDLIHEKAGGWAAGLVMMTKRARTAGELPIVAGTLRHEEIFDYFAAELFDKAEEPIRDFLLRTAVLPHIMPSLATKLTGLAHADRILEKLNRGNYFTEKRSGRELSYQYHPLFRHFLLNRIQTLLHESELQKLRTTGAQLLEQSGQIEDAAELYVVAQEWNGLAGLILKHAQELVAQGRSTTLGEWLSHIPQEVTDQSPWLLYWMGLGRFFASYSEGRKYLEQAFHLFEVQGDTVGAMLSWSGAVDTIVYEFGNLNLLEKWVDWFNGFIAKQTPFPSPVVEYRAVTSMISALLLSGRGSREIRPWVERAVRLMHECPDRNLQIHTSIYVTLFYLWTGDQETLGSLVHEQVQWSRDPKASPMSKSMVSYSSSLYHWITAFSDFGINAATEGLATSAAHGVHVTDNHLVAMQLIGALNKGDLVAAAEYHLRLESLGADTLQRHIVKYPYHHLAPWHALAAGDYAAADEKSQESLKMFEKTGGPAFPHAITRSTAALALIYLNEYAGAQKHVAQVLRIAEAMESPLIEFCGLLLEALRLLHERKSAREGAANDQGIMTLRRALSLGKARKYMNTIVWHEPAMTELFITALECGIEIEYVQKIIRKRNLMPEAPPVHVEHWPWPFRIFTLGRFEIEQNNKPLRFSGKVPQKPLALLKALISFGGKDVRAEKLMDLLWPDAEGDAALSAFSTTLQRLRYLFGNEKCILLQDSKLSFDPRMCWIDAWAFERTVDEAGRNGHNSSSPHTDVFCFPPVYEKAVALYKGHFLHNDVDCEWTISYRERLRSKFLSVTTGMGDYFEQTGQWNSALDCYQRALEVDDLSEEIYQRIMFCHTQLGRKAEAIATYKRCCASLATSMGITPSEKTQRLYKEITNQQ